jgi:D-alanyl-D-alanine carboxypeptidase/D-alanyl-D-alanine-endopeptidase (penicillin-binding protein 4)
VKVSGKVIVGATPGRLRSRPPLAAVDSPPVSELITQTNRPSNATYAEMLTKRLDAGGSHPATTAGGIATIESFARRIGAPLTTENGSGLTRLARSTPRHVVDLLEHMDHVHSGRVFRQSLPAACLQGTLTHRMCGTAAVGNCRAKTGTLDDVSALSGYCEAGGHRIAFSILMNAVTSIDSAHIHQDHMTALIARYRP